MDFLKETRKIKAKISACEEHIQNCKTTINDNMVKIEAMKDEYEGGKMGYNAIEKWQKDIGLLYSENKKAEIVSKQFL